MTMKFLQLLMGTVLLHVMLARSETPIRALILDGQSGGPYHAWQKTTPILKKMLQETGMYQVEVATSPPVGGDFSKFNPPFNKYQVVVSNYDAADGQWSAALQASFERYMENGGGLVVVHAADNAFPGWPAYNQMIGIGGWRNRDEKSGPLWYYRDGRLVSDASPGPAGSHGKSTPYQIVIRDDSHPITRGLPKVWMHATDELYNSLRGPGQNMHLLATAYSDPANKGTGRDEPMLLVLTYGRGRIFHTIMGHDVAAMSCVGFITTFQRGTEWAATGRVTLPVPADFPTADKVSVRSSYAAAGVE
jgi:type 1 glutamine amidotransferase